MASTNKTPNYNLPQWSESDKIEFSPDVNNAFSAIDAGMKANAANIGLSQYFFKYRGSITGLNADTMADGGWWLANGISDPVSQGLPSGFTYCILINFNTDAWLSAQIVINLATGVMKKRQRPASSHSAWVDV